MGQYALTILSNYGIFSKTLYAVKYVLYITLYNLAPSYDVHVSIKANTHDHRSFFSLSINIYGRWIQLFLDYDGYVEHNEQCTLTHFSYAYDKKSYSKNI